jgi:putative flavoprotein involved in K+ transport
MTEQITEIDTLVVGAGQAGVAMSEHLTRLAFPTWCWKKGYCPGLAQRTLGFAGGQRPGLARSVSGHGVPGLPADSFVGKEQVADYFAAYARSFNAPIRTGVEVFSAERLVGRPGFRVDTSLGVIEAQRIVAATGPFQRPVIPAIAPQSSAIQQLHSAHYFNPQQLPEGGVLVVGAAPPACRLPMSSAGRTRGVAVGRRARPPAASLSPARFLLVARGAGNVGCRGQCARQRACHYRGERRARRPYRRFSPAGASGVTLVGQTRGFTGQSRFRADLAENIRRGDASYLALLDAADEWYRRNGLSLPEEPSARFFCPTRPA